MKKDMLFTFDRDKNTLLRQTRNISFEDVIYAIGKDKILDIFPNLSPQYAGQYVFVVEVDGYAYQVPFRHEEACVHLITVFPSRKATKKYLGEA